MKEESRQMIVLALAELAIARPGWLPMIRAIAVEEFDAAEMFEGFRDAGEQNTFPARWARGYEAYRTAPSEPTAMPMLTLGQEWVAKEPLPAMGPVIAIYSVMLERGNIAPGLEAPLKSGLALMKQGFEQFPTRPGWNDYHMVRWQLTGVRSELEEIHRRHLHLMTTIFPRPYGEEEERWQEVARTANWMVTSYRQRDPDFDAQMKQVEAECPWCQVVHAA